MTAWVPDRLVGSRFAPYAPLVARLASLPTWPTIAALDRLLADHLRGPDHPAIRHRGRTSALVRESLGTAIEPS